MLGSSLIVAGAALVCATAFAQQQIPSSKMYPITATPKHVTIDFVTGKRIPAGSQVLAANVQTIYNNTCTWATAAYYSGFANCEENYDEGRIPSTAPGSGSPVSWDGFSFAYCTFNAASFACEIAFADNAGGPCAGLIPQTPPTWAASTVYTEIDLAPLGLPGSPANNTQACWIVGITNLGLCIKADGDGTFDGNPTTDLFTWGFHHQMPTQPAGAEGIFISGDPGVATGGSCTYNIPCGTDPFSLTPCGTGLDTDDQTWINDDGTPYGSSVPTNCPTGIARYGFGTNCYWFGGWPANPLASYYFTMEGGRTCSAGNGTSYCTVSPSLNGCLPSMSATGTPSIANPAGYTVTATGAPGQKNGIHFFGVNSPANNVPFSNGTLCVTPPLIRCPVTNTGGSALCDGVLSYTMAVVQTQAANFGSPISAGSTVRQQAWIRDPASVPGSAVSNGWFYTVQP